MLILGIFSKNLLNSNRLCAKSAFSICSKSKIHSVCSKLNPSFFANRTRQTIPIRHIFGIFRRTKKDQLKIIDNIPDEFNLIYRNSMERYVSLVQIITTVSTLVLVLITIINNDVKKFSSIYPLEEDLPQATENEVYYYAAGFITFVVILQMLVYKLPMRIYYLSQQKQYTFIFYGNVPMTKRKLSCNIGEVIKLPDKEHFLWWTEMKYRIKDQQDIILSENAFRRPADLYIMLGVQRDPDHDTPK